jgi:hypothetical protein
MERIIRDASEIEPPDREALPDWCRVYEGLSDQEIAEVENDVLDRAVLTRPS